MPHLGRKMPHPGCEHTVSIGIAPVSSHRRLGRTGADAHRNVGGDPSRSGGTFAAIESGSLPCSSARLSVALTAQKLMNRLIQNILLFPTSLVSVFAQAVLQPFRHSERHCRPRSILIF